VEAVDYLLERFGVVSTVEAAFKAKDFVVAKVKARLEKVAAKRARVCASAGRSG
jgi:hypothetical protein